MKTENKLIAEFMGMEEERHTDGRYLFTTDLEEEKGIDTRFTEELYFHISWDWLMPVVESCFERLDARDNSADEIKRQLLVCNLRGVYTAVVEFINQYKNNK